MAATATKRKEPQLSEEVKELYARCWNILDEKLPKLGIDSTFLQKMKDPEEVNRRANRDFSTYSCVSKTQASLNSIFASRNKLPERVTNSENLVNFISGYIKKNFGRELDLIISKTGPEIATDSKTSVIFKEGTVTLHEIFELSHEFRHFDESFASKFKEIEKMVFPVANQPNESARMDFWSKLTGASREMIVEEKNLEGGMYGFIVAPVLLLHLYDSGIYKPADEKTRQNLEFSRFMMDKNMRRAFLRYQEGRANFALVGMLDSSDDIIKSYAAAVFLVQLSFPTAQVFSEISEKGFAMEARKLEGFRAYYALHERIGEEKLKKFEGICSERAWVPGIDINDRLVIIDTKRLRIFEVDTDKMMDKAPKLPEKMD